MGEDFGLPDRAETKYCKNCLEETENIKYVKSDNTTGCERNDTLSKTTTKTRTSSYIK